MAETAIQPRSRQQWAHISGVPAAAGGLIMVGAAAHPARGVQPSNFSLA
jgi:hypothetical protein